MNIKPPRAGAFGWYQYEACNEPSFFHVRRVEGSLCYIEVLGDGRPPELTSFIWRFSDGLNALHWWQGKPKGADAPAGRGFLPDFTLAHLTLQGWLDARHYGLTAEQHRRLMDQAIDGDRGEALEGENK